MALTAAILIAVYVITLVGVLLWPVKQRDPQMGMAQGCLGIVVVCLLVLGGLLAIGYFFHQQWLIDAIFWMTVVPFILLVCNLIVQPFIKMKRNREAKQWATPPAAPIEDVKSDTPET